MTNLALKINAIRGLKGSQPFQVPIRATMAKDPTQTIMLRHAWIMDTNARFGALKSVIRTSIVDNDCFGLKEKPKDVAEIIAMSRLQDELDKLTPVTPNGFAYNKNQRKVSGFMSWLREQEQLGILEVTAGRARDGVDAWSNVYIRSSYQKGLQRARQDLIATGVELNPFSEIPGGVGTVFKQPFHAEAVGLIYTRVYDELRGVTRAMDGDISRVLSRGLAEGKGPEALARALNQRVDAIGVNRARLIARTETVLAFNTAAINSYTSAEQIIGKTIYVQWWTAGDAKVRPAHIERHGEVYKKDEAYDMLGEPNCRCTVLPYIPDWKTKGKVGGVEGKGVVPSEAMQEAVYGGPGIISAIIDIASQGKYMSADDVVEQLIPLFPGRSAEAMRKTVTAQLGSQLKSKGYVIEKMKEGRKTLYKIARKPDGKKVKPKPKPKPVVKPKPDKKVKPKPGPTPPPTKAKTVTGAIIDIASEDFVTVDQVTEALKKLFPDRVRAKMRKTVQAQLGSQLRAKGYVIEKYKEGRITYYKITGKPDGKKVVPKKTTPAKKTIPKKPEKIDKAGLQMLLDDLEEQKLILQKELTDLNSSNLSSIDKYMKRTLIEAELKQLRLQIASVYYEQKDFAAIRQMKRDRVFPRVSKDSQTLLAKSGKLAHFNKVVDDAFDYMPYDLVEDLMENSKIYLHDKRYFRAYHQGMYTGGDLYSSNIHLGLYNLDSTTMAHEFAHAIDQYWSGKRNRVGGWWSDSKYIKKKDGDKYRKLFKNQHSGKKRIYTNGDGEYWEDNWIHNYEGRVYTRSYGDTGIEWWSMNMQRYAEYRTIQNDLKSNIVKTQRVWRRDIDFLKQTIKEAPKYSYRSEYAKKQLKKYGDFDKYIQLKALEVSNWDAVREKYTHLAKFIEDKFNTNFIAYGK